jgi:hypothetical protein
LTETDDGSYQIIGVHSGVAKISCPQLEGEDPYTVATLFTEKTLKFIAETIEIWITHAIVRPAPIIPSGEVKEYKVKMAIIGDYGIGKTTLMWRISKAYKPGLDEVQ